MSKRAAQVARNLARFDGRVGGRHPGREPGPAVTARLTAMAWDHQRPAKKPSHLRDEAGWRAELGRAGYTPDLPRVPCRPPRELDELRVQEVADRALDRCAAAASTWTRHTVQEHVTRIITEAGVRATPQALSELITITTRLAVEDCLSVLPPGAAAPDHVAHLTSLRVIAVETRLRDLLAARATADAAPGAGPDPGGARARAGRRAGPRGRRRRLRRSAGGRGGRGRGGQDHHARRRHPRRRRSGPPDPHRDADEEGRRRRRAGARRPGRQRGQARARQRVALERRRRLDPARTSARPTPRPAAPTAAHHRRRGCGGASGSWSTRPGCSTRTPPWPC